MFERNSRYYDNEKAFHTCSDGSKIVYVKRRFLPKINRNISYQTIICCASDRLDLIAERFLGGSEESWRICDVNYELNPMMYCIPGRLIKIPVR
jgi:hypothetical protein